MARSIAQALTRSLRGAGVQVREGALAALAEAYAEEIDGAEQGEDRREALKDLGPKLQAALVALAPVARPMSGVSDDGSESGDAPPALTADQLAERRQADALGRLQGRAKARGKGA